VAARHHIVLETFPKSESELMLRGTVKYTMKNGREVLNQWAGRMTVTAEGKISFYQVYIDSSPILVASGKTLRGDANGQLEIV
jgi:hypothetical protein